jgi:hypothetical protein
MGGQGGGERVAGDGPAASGGRQVAQRKEPRSVRDTKRRPPSKSGTY